jgi:hypothetical protein
MSYSDFWKANFQRVKKTEKTFPKLTQLCIRVLESMGYIGKKWGLLARARGKKLPPYQQFVSIYFQRNITFLRGAYLLACRSLCEPSRDLQRTTFETILRGYLFTVKKKEANLMYSLIEGTIKPEEKDALRKKKYWPFRSLVRELYTKETRKSCEKFYDRLSRSSHPSIMGTFADLRYSSEMVEDCLNTILALSYNNVQMMAEGFFDFLDNEFKEVIRATLKDIADAQEVIVIFEPDKEIHSSKIKLKKGNFMKVLI